MSASNSKFLEDESVGVRLKTSTLWIATLFLSAYGDIFGFFRTGQIGDVVAGEVSGIKIALSSVPSRYEHGRVFHAGGAIGTAANAAAAYGRCVAAIIAAASGHPRRPMEGFQRRR